MNVLIGIFPNSVADIEEFHCKRDEDAQACGRTIRTILPLRKKSSPTILIEDSRDNDSNMDSVAMGALRGHVSFVKYT